MATTGTTTTTDPIGSLLNQWRQPLKNASGQAQTDPVYDAALQALGFKAQGAMNDAAAAKATADAQAAAQAAGIANTGITTRQDLANSLENRGVLASGETAQRMAKERADELGQTNTVNQQDADQKAAQDRAVAATLADLHAQASGAYGDAYQRMQQRQAQLDAQNQQLELAKKFAGGGGTTVINNGGNLDPAIAAKYGLVLNPATGQYVQIPTGATTPTADRSGTKAKIVTQPGKQGTTAGNKGF